MNTTNTPAIAPLSAEELDKVYVECRECARCGHIGINDSSDTQAACHNCEWTGATPAEDHCPGCAETNCMAAACPKCGWCYALLAEADIAQARLAAQPVVTSNHDIADRLSLWLSSSLDDHLRQDEYRKHIRAWLEYGNNGAALAAPVAAQADTTEQDEWRVGEFWSSANPGMRVLMLARGIDIENFGQHKDFIRWVGRSSADADATSAGEADTTASVSDAQAQPAAAPAGFEAAIGEWMAARDYWQSDDHERVKQTWAAVLKFVPLVAAAAPVSQAVEQPADDAEDAARLDFLDTNVHRFRMGWEIGAAPVGNLSVRSIIMGGKPIREAIDAAMSATKQEDA